MAVSIRKRAISELVQADCPATHDVKDVVRISADEVGGIYQVEKVDIDDPLTHPLLGVIVQKLTSTRCVVQIGGEIKGLYTGLTAGEQLFVDASSRLTHSVPSRPATGVRSVYPMAIALANSTLLLRALWPVRLVA